MAKSAKTVTLRLPEERYKMFLHFALRDDRPLSNLIETAAWRHLQECTWMEGAEEEEILKDKKLLKNIRRGIKEAKGRQGRLVG